MQHLHYNLPSVMIRVMKETREQRKRPWRERKTELALKSALLYDKIMGRRERWVKQNKGILYEGGSNMSRKMRPIHGARS